jgi:acyl-CoA synthetase (AMP-forming)/AMP-acid ligase II
MVEFVDDLAAFGETPALVASGRPAISYAELDRRVAETAREFGNAKKLIAVEAEPSEHAIIAYLAALRGRHAVALLPRGDGEAMDAFVDDFLSDAVCRRVDGRWRNVVGNGSPSELHPDLALLLGTSGSTGKSRYVRLSARAVNANAASIACYLGLTPADRAGLILPFHYSYGLSVLNSHLAVGASVHLAGKGAADAGFADEMRAARCTGIAGVPYSYELMDKTGFRDAELPDLRFMTVAGGRIEPALAETFRRHLAVRGKQLFLMYGQTEATARIAYVPPKSLAGKLDSIGIAIPGGSLRLLDEDGAQVEEAGQAGELAYRGPNVMMGYAESRSDLARGNEVEELRTGDIATRDAHGFFRIVGRRKRFSKIGGLRINHAGIEHALAAKGIVAAVAGDDRRLVAAVSSSHRESETARIMAAASGLTPLHVTARKVEALPRLATGKIDYAAVMRLFDRDEQKRNETVVDAFRHAFYPQRPTATDSFETLGGDSLLYVQLSLALERALGRAPDGWERLTIAELASMSRRESRWRAIDSDIVLRAAAILLVVVHHATLWPIPGGAATLVLLVGFGIARFQAASLFAGRPARMLRALAQNLAVYVPILAGFALARGEVPWASLFLVGNLGLTDPAKMLPYLYWFVEVYAQVILLAAALFAWRSARRWAAARPFGFGLALLATTVAAKFLVPLIWKVGAAQIFTVTDVLYLAVFGWCVHFARSMNQRAITLVLATMLFPVLAYTGGNWIGSWVKFSLQLLVVATLLYLPRLRLPLLAVQAVLPVAAASYHIYLFHRILPDLLLPQPVPGAVDGSVAAAAVVGGMAIGLAVFALQKFALGVLANRHAATGHVAAVHNT